MIMGSGKRGLYYWCLNGEVRLPYRVTMIRVGLVTTYEVLVSCHLSVGEVDKYIWGGCVL